MPSPPKRPRDKGGTSLLHLPDKVPESSNSTATMFVGGIKKGWMTGDPMSIDRSSMPGRQKSNSTTPTLGSADARPGNLPPMRSTAETCQDTPSTLPTATHVSKSSSNTSPPSMALTRDSQTSRFQTAQVNTVLPSPPPSDEPRQESIHIIDLEEEEEQEIGSENLLSIARQTKEQHNVPNTRPVVTEQTNQQDANIRWTEKSAEGYGEIDDSRKHSQSKEILPTNNPLSGIGPAYNGNTTRKRTTGDDLHSNKRLQKLAVTSPTDSILSVSQSSTTGVTDSTSDAIPFSPSEADMRQSIGRITSRLEFVQHARARRGPIEDGRLLLLRDACECFDHDYLLLHQLHCMKTRDPGFVQYFSALGFGTQHLQGLNILDQLIRANAELVGDAVEWFTNFPLPNRVLLECYTAYQLSYGRVLRCLEKLAEFWQSLRALCQERHYVPLVDELNALDLRSVVLQRVISRAILRNIWLLPQDNCFHSSEKLFLINQQDVYQRYTPVATPAAVTEACKRAYNQNLIISYLRLWDQHQLHHSQYEKDCQARNGRGFPGVMPEENPQRGQPYHSQSRSLPARSASDNDAESFDQAHRPYTLDVSMLVDRGNSKNVSGHTPMLPVESIAGAQMIPVSWSHLVPGQRSMSSALPPPESILPSHAEFPDTRHSSAVTGDFNGASSSAIFHDRPQLPHTTPVLSSVPEVSPSNRLSESVMVITQADTSLNSILARARGWTEQSPRGSPAAVPSTPLSLQATDVHRQHAGIRQQSRIQGHSHPHHPGVNMPHEQIDSQGETQRLSTPSQCPLPPLQFFPPPGYIQEPNVHPNAVESALHQVHLRSPILRAINLEKQDKTIKHFRFVWGFAVMPNRLHVHKRHVRWTFTVSKESAQLLAKTVDELDGSPPTRTVDTGSRLCRIRCIQVSDPNKDISEDGWTLAENAWPRTVAMLLNETSLEIRRKLHYGKDLPIDVSHYIQEGQNTLSIATMWLPSEDKAVYAVGLETLQVTTDKKIKESVVTLERSEAQRRITERVSNLDPEVQIIDPSIILDITDPYTSSIFKTPVRGKSCRHTQCFDLDIFLQTRGSKTPGEPCEPDQFRCPICGGDARPQNLMIDGFFMEVREELSKANRLDARAIILHESGDWHIKEVEETGEGDGSGNHLSRAEEALTSGVRKSLIRRESEVVEIDDD